MDDQDKKEEFDEARRKAPEEEEASKAEPPKLRINPVVAVFMLLLALAVDGAQILLDFILIGVVVNSIIDIYTWLIFYVWFKALGISFGVAKGTKFGQGSLVGGNSESLLKNPLVVIAVALVVEFIPVVNALPAWTAAIAITIVIEHVDYIIQKLGMFKTLLRPAV